MTELIPIHPHWPGAWETIKGYFQRAVEAADAAKSWGVEDIYSEAEAGRMQLWGVRDGDEIIGAVATQELLFPKRRVLEVCFAGANDQSEERWLPLFKTLSQMARRAGFAGLMFGGRKGWARKLPGVKPIYKFEVEFDGRI